MKVIYHCFGGSHSSVTAAAIHLGMLDKHRKPSSDELIRLPYYDKTNNRDFGTIRFMGQDKQGNQVYVLGKKSLGNRYSNILLGVADLLGVKEDLMVINCMPEINWIMKIGGFISRRLKLTWLGRPLVTRGTVWSYKSLTRLVNRTVLKLKNKR